MPTLTSAARRVLRANAHALHPVVAVGQHGLTPAVMKEIDLALKAHELIKVRVFDDDREAREALLAKVCAELDCAPVQHIGKLLVVWRPNPPAPPAAKKPPRSTKSAAKTSTGPRTRAGAGTKPPGGASHEGGAGARRRRAATAAAEAPAPAGRRQRSRAGTAAPAAPATRGAPSRRRRRIVKS